MKDNSARMAKRTALIVAAALVFTLLCLYSCATAPRATHVAPDADPSGLLASLKERSKDITSFRGIGKLILMVKGERQTMRVAWIGSQPGDVRVETLGLWGQPNLTFLIKGSMFYIHARQEDRCYKGKATARNMSRFLSVPVRPEDLFVLLSGQVPVLPFHYVKIRHQEGEDQSCLCLYKKWRRLVQRLWVNNTGKTVTRIEVFDGWGHLQYSILFSRFDEEGLGIADKIIISNDSGSVLSLDVENLQTGVQIPGSAFTPVFSCVQVVDLDS